MSNEYQISSEYHLNQRIAALQAEVDTLKEHVAAQSWPERFECWKALGFPQGHEGDLVEAIAALKAKSDRLSALLSDAEWLALCSGDHVDMADIQRHELDALILARATPPQDAGGKG